MPFNIAILKRILLFLLGIFVLLYLFVLFLVPKIADINKYSTFIEKQVETSTGLKFSAENMELKTIFSPYINLYAYHVRFLYPDGTTCFKVTDANIKIRVLPLLFKKIEFKKIILNRPVLALSIKSDGATSLDKYIININNAILKSDYKAKNNIPEVILYNYKVKVSDANFSSPFVLSGKELKCSDIVLGESLHVKADGVLSYKDKKFIDYNFDVVSPIQVDKKRIFNVNPFQNIYKYNLCTKVNAKLKYDKKPDKSTITGNIDLKDLSFVINNKPLSGNFINLAFNNNDIEISAKLKTSPKEIATIIGKYSYGLNKKLQLNVKAANSDLANLSELLTAIFTSFNIKNQFSEYKVSGFANFNFNIDTDFKKLRSDGIASLKDVSIKSNKYPVSITDINSEISFKNDFINILSASAFINNTPVKIKGSFDSDTNVIAMVSADKLPFNAFKNAFFPEEYKKSISVLNGELYFSANISGKLNNIIVKSTVTVKDAALKYLKENIDLKAQTVNIAITLKNRKLDVVSDLYNLYLYRQDFRFPLTSQHLSFGSDGENIDIKKSKIKWNYSDLFLSGYIANISKSPESELKLFGSLYSADLYNLLRLSSNMKASPKGRLPVVVELKSKEGINKIKAQIFANAENYLSYVVIKELLKAPSVLNLSIENRGKMFKLEDCSLYKAKSFSNYDTLVPTPNFFAKIAGLYGGIDISSGVPVADNCKFVVPESLTVSVLGFKNSEISVKTDLSLDGKITAPDVRGNIYLNGLSIPDYNLKIGAGSIVISKENGNLRLPNISIGKSKLSIYSDILLPASTNLSLSDVKISSPELDLDDLIQISSQLSKYLPGIKLPVNFKNGELSVDKFKAQDIVASNINADISLNNNIMHLNRMTADAYNGRVSGDVTYNLLSSLVSLNLKGTSLDGSQAMTAITGIKDDLSGKLDFYSNISFHGASRYEQLQSLKGNFNMVAYNGKLKTLGSFEHFLYAQNLISQSIMKASINLISKAVAPKNTGLFKTLHTNVSFYSGYANVKSLKFSGPNMSMYMDGKFNMLNNIASVDIIGKVSGEVVSVLGPFGDLSLSNIVSSSTSTPLPNIFFNSYNQKISRSEYEKIPNLVPETNLKTKPFSVKIIGPVESIKSVKSFKWLVVSDSVQSVREPEAENIQEEAPPQAKKLQREYSNPRQPSNELPSFLDKLPDEIK